jgi:integrase
VFKSPKTQKGRREIPLDDDTVNTLCRLREGEAGELVIHKSDGTPRDPSRVTHDFADMAKHAGLEMRFHGLRHSFTTFGLLAGVDPRIMQELLGHEDALTTANYTHVMREVKRNASNAIASVLREGGRGELLLHRPT